MDMAFTMVSPFASIDDEAAQSLALASRLESGDEALPLAEFEALDTDPEYEVRESSRARKRGASVVLCHVAVVARAATSASAWRLHSTHNRRC
jgi:hypothetical protein